MFFEDNRRDQVAADDKKDINAYKAATEKLDPCMKQDDWQNGDGSKPINFTAIFHAETLPPRSIGMVLGKRPVAMLVFFARPAWAGRVARNLAPGRWIVRVHGDICRPVARGARAFCQGNAAVCVRHFVTTCKRVHMVGLHFW